MRRLLELLEKTADALDEVDLASETDPERERRLRDILECISARSRQLLDTFEPTEGAPSEADRREYREELLEEGLAALARNQFDAARQHFEEGIEEFPEDLDFLNHLGLVCWEEGAYREAARWYGRAMEIGLRETATEAGNACDSPPPAYHRAIEGRALSLERLGETDSAAELFDALATMAPSEYAGCHYLAGVIHHERGALDEAIETYERAPAEPAVLYNLGLAEYQTGQLEDAAADLIRAFETNPHVAALLLDDDSEPSTERGGYIGSPAYAEEVVESSASLWRDADGAHAFLERCFDHPLVEEYLETTAQRDTTPLQRARGSDLDDPRVDGIAEHLVERMEGT